VTTAPHHPSTRRVRLPKVGAGTLGDVRERISNLGAGAGWVLVGVGTVLLLSYGGAIVAAPLTVPLLFLAARASSSKSFRVCAGIVVVLTIAELAWALTYFTVGEARPLIWLVPTLATLAACVAYARLSKPLAVRRPVRERGF
jgi:hypothetical protein